MKKIKVKAPVEPTNVPIYEMRKFANRAMIFSIAIVFVALVALVAYITLNF